MVIKRVRLSYAYKKCALGVHMEYIKRRKKYTQRKKSAGAGRFVVVMLFCAAAVYLISASAAGTWLAENMIAPVFSGIEETLSGKIRPNDAGKAESVSHADDGLTEQEEITLPALSCYMLQMGVYSEYENAVAQAQALQTRGAGGYILEDFGRHRVIASGYDTLEKLDSVRQQLNEDGIETAKYEIHIPEMVFRVTANKKQINALSESFSALEQAQGELELFAAEFDRSGMSVEEGRAAAKEILAPLEEKRPHFSSNQEQGTILSKVLSCYDNSAAAIALLAESECERTVDFSSKIKYTHLQVTHEYAKLIENLSSTS